jgi:hypothetical protein
LDLFTVYFLTAFGRRPQHMLGTAGLVAFLAGSMGVAALTLMWVLSRLDDEAANDVHLHERALFYYSMGAVLLGAQFLSVGLLAELFTAFARDDAPPYSVATRVGESAAVNGDGQGDRVPTGPSSRGEGP